MADVKNCGDGRVHGRHSWEEADPPKWHVCSGVTAAVLDDWGMTVPVADVTGMSWPVKCTRCHHVHDGGLVTVVQRYTDCSTWLCPRCGSLIDDRPVSWGGSAIQLDHLGREKR